MKFKKHISFFLAFFLLVSNVGLAFNVHYCGGEVSSIEPVYLQSNAQREEDCCGEKVEKQNNCCRDITFHFQEKSENTLLKSFSFNANIVFLKEESYSRIVSPIFKSPRSSRASYHYEAHAPPFFKLYHQYIFYG